MIIRKFIRHLREQDWFAAGIDFFIVVLGIFVALQVDNFNKELQARADEQAYMQRLLDDAIYNEKQINNVIQAHKSRAVRAKAGLDVLMDVDAQPKDQEALIFNMMMSVDIASVKLSHGAYSELISTGKLGLLTDEKLKKLLQEEFATNRFVDGSLDIFRRLSTSPIAPTFKHISYTEGDNGFNQLPTTYDFDSLRQDKEFVGAVMASIGGVQSFVYYREMQLKSVQDLREFLECKLEKVSCTNMLE